MNSTKNVNDNKSFNFKVPQLTRNYQTLATADDNKENSLSMVNGLSQSEIALLGTAKFKDLKAPSEQDDQFQFEQSFNSIIDGGGALANGKNDLMMNSICSFGSFEDKDDEAKDGHTFSKEEL